MKSSALLTRIVAIATAWALIVTPAYACTGLALKAEDGAYVSGRTAEFGVQLELGVLFIPRETVFQGTLPGGASGIKYSSKYAAVGVNAFDERTVLDGLNEKGLGVGGFYFPGYAGYASVSAENKDKALSPTEFPTWILAQFATTDEVKAALGQVAIVDTVIEGWGDTPPPFHYVVYDAAGNSIVIEPVDGSFRVYDNPTGTMANSPSFDWHLTNLNNYVNLSTVGPAPKSLDGLTLQSMSTGTGLHGMPGDFSSPSRFVRAAIFSATTTPSQTSEEAVARAFHLLNQFDIPPGAVRTDVGDNDIEVEWTLATVVRDSKNLTYSVRTFDDQTIRRIDLGKLDPDGKAIVKFDLAGEQAFIDLTPKGTDYTANEAR